MPEFKCSPGPGPKGFEPHQILITHAGLWEAMLRWAADHRFRLDRVPDGVGDIPTYSFIPKET